jgi:hypothetical protein
MLVQFLFSIHCDLVLLFDAAKIRTSLTARMVNEGLITFFGERLATIKAFCRREKNTGRQEEYILDVIRAIFKESGYLTLPFAMGDPEKLKNSHYLFFATKAVPAYQRFKELILPYSDLQEDGVPLMGTYQTHRQQLSLFPEHQPYSVAKLANELAQNTAVYKYKSVQKIFEDHSIGTPYILENYRLAVETLRNQGKVELLNAKTMQTVRKPTYTSIIKFKTV